MGDIQKRLDNVRQMIQSQDFLEGKGLSNKDWKSKWPLPPAPVNA